MALKLLGKFNFRIVLFVGILLVLITIFLCYGLAVSLGHKDAWLPTISECGVLPPEMYFFRWGILVGGLLLVVEAVVLHTASRVSNTAAWLGGIAGFLLTGVAVVSADDDITLHLMFALPFFLLEDIAIVMIIIQNWGTLKTRSLAIKIPSATVACVATAIRYLLEFGVIKMNHGDIDWTIIAIVEWINVIVLLLFHLSLSGDLDDLYVAELEEEPDQITKTDGSPPLIVKTPLK